MSVRNPFAHYIFWLVILLMTVIGMHDAFSQCNTLRAQFDITFNTDQDCAPTSVTDFTITYTFNVAQDPNSISILFEWNDPSNATTLVDNATGLIPSAGNTQFTATGTFTYPVNNDCGYLPVAYILINGVSCPTSAQEQRAFSWARDNEFGGMLSITPEFYDVCYGDPITNAVFADDSFFNCNITAEPDNPNQQERHVQFVYGTNHNAGSSINNLSLNDGAIQNLTNGTGALAGSLTRGTAGLMITGAYFGPVDNISFPANGPTSTTFPMSAPADLANAIGNTFEITMFNWNICNPYNGDPINPNYDEAISTTAYIRIIDGPNASFVTRKDDSSGLITTDFCIGDVIYFDNQSSNSSQHTWEFFDDDTGIISLGTSSDTNPTFSYSTSGLKLIRLNASNNAAQSNCTGSTDIVVNITPSLNSQIGLTDLANNPITPVFCQNLSNPQTFDVRFNDVSVGTITPTTEWRWEFFDENDVLVREEPGPGFSSSQLGPFDLGFTNVGSYRSQLTIRDAITGCANVNEVFVIVYENPRAEFVNDRVCDGFSTHFTDMSSLNAINGESIMTWEWDFDYDGTIFTKDPAFDNQVDFDYTYASSGNYNVALRIQTDQNGCSDIFIKQVIVDPLPIADFTPDKTADCSILTVNFTNNGVGAQQDLIAEYIWEIDDGSGYSVVAYQDPSAAGFSNIFTYDFVNSTTNNITYEVRLRVISENTCETVSSPTTITVFPGALAGFSSLNYSPFADNCSPVSVDFTVDAITQSLNPSEYIWTIDDENGQVVQTSTGTTPTFTYDFINNTQAIKNYDITLSSILAAGCSGDSTRTISVNPLPNASFTLDTLILDCEIMVVRATATQQGLNNYSWEVFENSALVNTFSGMDNFIEYSVNRNVNDIAVEIALVTENYASCKSSKHAENYIVPADQNINASFSVTPIVQSQPNTTVDIINMTNSGPWSYLWDFGDGNTSDNPNISSHTYDSVGMFTITLSVSYLGCVETAVQSIVINPISPEVDFDFSVTDGCAPLTVSFSNLSQYTDPDSYLWNFGEGQGTSNASNPTHTYFEPGIYTVALTASNILGDTVVRTKTDIIEVFPQPVAAFGARPNVVIVPDNPVYVSNRSLNATDFIWDFGDGTNYYEPEPIHYYKEGGIFTISLIAKNSYGCADTLVREGIIEGRASGRILIPNAFSPNLDGPASNGSGTNDVFLPRVQRVKEFEMLIYNRWGELLFQSTDQEIGWNGYYKGNLMPQDVYVYKLNLVFDSGDKTTRAGDVNLIR